ncbi:MAG: ATP-dependent DNA helicase RecG [Deltaproteobacteria bacterium]|nr:ATP-dependent DNA helicase RecG [Deltaproteobacteria bacterium]MBW1951106.1 ATP-dependent DNA helicase RecG [Deltaproteobacteria bacterium]MBW2347198.1 ATP-dependent DNA helicase RecG [Deltaproteobacteria bacterium]
MSKETFNLPEQFEKTASPVTVLRGLGPKRAGPLAERGIRSVADLLFFFPSRYEDRRVVSPMGSLREGESVLVEGEVLLAREERFPRSGKRLYRVVLRDHTGRLVLLWFHYRKRHLASLASPGTRLAAFGKVSFDRGLARMIHPDVRPPTPHGDDATGRGFVPVYPAVRGMPQGVIRRAVLDALERFAPAVSDPVPAPVLRRLGLPDLREAIRYVHRPPDHADPEALRLGETPWQRRFRFDRLFRLMLEVGRRKRGRRRRDGPVLEIPPQPHRVMGDFLPFDLTPDQVRVIQEIARDMMGPAPMNRLVQGDVGCGKTVVAAAAAGLAALNGMQTALMAPTQVLAMQHFEFFQGLPAGAGLRPVLVTGGLGRKERSHAAEKIRAGRYNVIIGTHALFSERLEYARLGLVVIDEQHRFGVRQRARLDRKGANPHLLVMSATPIPRTLAMTLYADLDISTIRKGPSGRTPVETRLVERDRKREIDRVLRERLARGEQALVICPAVDGTEDADLKNVEEMARALGKIYGPRWEVGLLHGRMAPEEKERVMDRFRRGRLPLLAATTVVEVGVHAPRATVIVIEHPERFGLAQLHQLRGRVGRGERGGLCLLVVSAEIPPEARERLEVLVRTRDGFEIARKDLEIRGQGELTGIRQAGSGEVLPAEIFEQPLLLAQARSEAERILDEDPALALPENRGLLRWLGPPGELDV